MNRELETLLSKIQDKHMFDEFEWPMMKFLVASQWEREEIMSSLRDSLLKINAEQKGIKMAKKSKGKKRKGCK